MNAIELAEIMDAKARGERSPSGDPWGDFWCAEAARILREQHEALEPLVELARAVFHEYDDGRVAYSKTPDDRPIWGFDSAKITYGDLRRARRAYEGKVDEA